MVYRNHLQTLCCLMLHVDMQKKMKHKQQLLGKTGKDKFWRGGLTRLRQEQPRAEERSKHACSM